MSALSTIYQLRTALEEGIASSLVAQGFVVVTRQNKPDAFQQATPRIEVKADIGSATGRRHLCADNYLRFDAFACAIAVQCVTKPSATLGLNDQAEQFVASARAYMSSFGSAATFQNTTSFPNFYLAEPLRDSGSANTLKTDEGIEYTTLGYSGIVCIRHSAWPTS